MQEPELKRRKLLSTVEDVLLRLNQLDVPNRIGPEAWKQAVSLVVSMSMCYITFKFLKDGEERREEVWTDKQGRFGVGVTDEGEVKYELQDVSQKRLMPHTDRVLVPEVCGYRLYQDGDYDFRVMWKDQESMELVAVTWEDMWSMWYYYPQESEQGHLLCRYRGGNERVLSSWQILPLFSDEVQVWESKYRKPMYCINRSR